MEYVGCNKLTQGDLHILDHKGSELSAQTLLKLLPSVAPVVTHEQLEALWARLQQGLSDILLTGDTKNKSSLLDDADNLCIHGDQMVRHLHGIYIALSLEYMSTTVE